MIAIIICVLCHTEKWKLLTKSAQEVNFPDQESRQNFTSLRNVEQVLRLENYVQKVLLSLYVDRRFLYLRCFVGFVHVVM
jgi:hypothetical protein